MLIAGICLLLLTGLCWVGIAIVVNDAAEHNRDLDRIQFCTSGSLAVIALLALAFRLPSAEHLRNLILISIPVFFAGIANFAMLSLMKQGMRTGSPGSVWGIVQSALICPFLMGILFFGVIPTMTRIVGILLIVAGIVLFSRSKPRRQDCGKFWLLPTCGSFLFSGIAQCFANLPSYWSSFTMSPILRALLVQSGTVSAFVAVFLFRGKKKSQSDFRSIIKPVIFLTAVQALSLFFLFYRGLDLAARAGAGSIGYPIAQGSCIVFFIIYEMLRNRKKCAASVWLALILQCSGLLAISL